MKNSQRILIGLVGLIVIAAPTLAGGGRSRTHHNSSRASQGHRAQSNYGFSLSIGNSGSYPHSSRGRSYRSPGHSNYSSRGYGSYGNGHNNGLSRRSSYTHNYGYSYGHSRYGRRSHSNNRYYSSSYEPAVVYQQPIVRQPVVIQRPIVIDRPVYQTPIREVPAYSQPAGRAVQNRYAAGWGALVAGDFGYAREYFTDQAVRQPTDPTPKAGLALARAAAGLDDQAEWAMRRAVRAGFARARDGLPMYDVERTLTSLEKRYEERSNAYSDRWFMLAATRYLLGDFSGARDASSKALSYDGLDGDSKRIYDLAVLAG